MKLWQKLVVFLVGVVGAGAFFALRLPSILPPIQVVLPGEHELTLDREGEYTVFWESTSVVDGRTYASTQLSGLRLKVRAADSGRELEVVGSSTNATYSTGSRVGQSVGAFVVETPGAYVLSGATGDGSEVVLAIGDFPLLAFMLQALGVFAVCAGVTYVVMKGRAPAG